MLTSLIVPLTPAARMPSPRAFFTVKPRKLTWELTITTPAKMVSSPRPGGLTTNVGVTPDWLIVAWMPTSDTGFLTTTCSWYLPGQTTTVAPGGAAFSADPIVG
jgi:hypothetical protein